jgi:uncharacterized protein
VQVLRAGMNTKERVIHDRAWGLEFPSPDTVLIPDRNNEFDETIANIMKKQIEANPSLVNSIFDGNRTLLHLECLSGRLPLVRVLLDCGADVSVPCSRGWTARDYARSLQWDDILVLLKNYG